MNLLACSREEAKCLGLSETKGFGGRQVRALLDPEQKGLLSHLTCQKGVPKVLSRGDVI